MNRKIALSSLSIMGALLIMGGATLAAFTTQATLANNTFATDTAEILISGDTNGVPTTYASNSIPGFSGTNIIPGFNETYTFWLLNTADMDMSLIANFTGVTGDEVLQDALKVNFSCFNDLGTTTTPFYSVNEWEAGQATIGALMPTEGGPNGAGGDEAKCTMTVNLPFSADNSVSNKTVSFNGVITGTQTE